MFEHEFDVQTKDGQMNTLMFRPEGTGPLPPIIMFMPASGVREELRSLARRLAAEGYLVLLPNMYYRTVRGVDVDANRLKDPDYQPVLSLMSELNKKLTNARVAIDTKAMLSYLDAEPMAKKQGVGVIGYCMGGRCVMTAMGHFPERIRAGAALYGGQMITDDIDSPHLLADKITGELFLGFADNDEYVPHSDVERLSKHLTAAGTKHSIEVYPDTEHGFIFPLRYCYQEKGAERSWARVFELFNRNLKG